ncbi:hypothetical protein GXW82_12875 [Streptacidiphilus sp. 4-A2]|nr:hypothetical protein [Streptacidiphilus sp. 4-A2]
MAGMVMVTSGEPTGHEVLVRYGGVLLLAFGPLLPLWRAPEHNTPGPLRLRRLLRRAVWRTAVLLAAGPGRPAWPGCPSSAGAWQGRYRCCRSPSRGPGCCSPGAAAERGGRPGHGGVPEGLPRPGRIPPRAGCRGPPGRNPHPPRPEEVAPRKSVRTISPRSSDGYPALVWTGAQLVLYDKRGRALRVPAACAEIVHAREINEQGVKESLTLTTGPSRVGAPYEASRNTRAIYLLDRDGYRLARVPAPGRPATASPR